MAASLSWAKVVPEEVNCKVESLYGYRADGQPGRIVSVELKGRELKGPVTIAVVTPRPYHQTHHPTPHLAPSFPPSVSSK